MSVPGASLSTADLQALRAAVTAGGRLLVQPEHAMDTLARLEGLDCTVGQPLVVQPSDREFAQYGLVLLLGMGRATRSTVELLLGQLFRAGRAVVAPQPLGFSDLVDAGALLGIEEEAELVTRLRGLADAKELQDRVAMRAFRTMRGFVGGVRTNAAPVANDAPVGGGVSAIVATARPEQIRHVMSTIGRQTHPDIELVLVTHGFEPDRREVDLLRQECSIDNMQLVTWPASEPFGLVVDSGFSAAQGDILTKMDDDDHYGDEYLSDMVTVLLHSGANLVGKSATYIEVEGLDTLVLSSAKSEHVDVPWVRGPTLTMKAGDYEEFGFAPISRGIDLDLAQRIHDADGRVYSGDRFNFVYQRSDHPHTWDADPHHFLRGAQVVLVGSRDQHPMC